MLVKRFRNLLEIAGARDRGHFRARHHCLTNDCVRKLKHAMDQATFFGAQETTLARLIDEPSQLFFRVSRRVLSCRLDADELHRAHAGPVKCTYWQTENAIEELHRQRDSQC